MSSFKDKPLKKCHTDKRKMVDDLHLSIMKELENNEKIDYYLDNGIILDQYYKDDVNESVNNITNTIGILNYFNNSTGEMSSGEKGKKELINEYICNIDDNTINCQYKD